MGSYVSRVFGAGGRSRTYNCLITGQLLYRLSYTGSILEAKLGRSRQPPMHWFYLSSIAIYRRGWIETRCLPFTDCYVGTPQAFERGRGGEGSVVRRNPRSADYLPPLCGLMQGVVKMENPAVFLWCQPNHDHTKFCMYYREYLPIVNIPFQQILQCVEYWNVQFGCSLYFTLCAF